MNNGSKLIILQINWMWSEHQNYFYSHLDYTFHLAYLMKLDEELTCELVL